MAANVQKTIDIVFNGVDDVSGVLGDIGNSLDSAGAGLQDFAAPFSAAQEKVLLLEAALGALAIGGLALAVNAAGQFDAQFRELTTLINDTGAGVDQFRDQIKSYASDSTQSIDQINAALYNAISLGVDYTDSLSALATAEQLAVAGKADLNSSTELLLGTLNAYGAEIEEASRYSDAFFTIVQDGKTTIPELAASFSQVTGTAAAAGVPIETLGSAVAAITAAGAPTAQAMTQIKAVIEGLIKPTKEAADFAAELGLEFSAQALEAHGLEGVMQQLHSATGGNVDEMAKLFTSSEALRAALILSKDASGNFSGALEDMENKTGATATAFDKMAGDIANSNQRLANNFTLTFEAIGSRVLDGYGGIADSITGIFQALQESISAGDFDEIFAAIDDVADGIESKLTNLAANLPDALGEVDFTDFADSIRTLAAETGNIFEAFFGDVDLATPEGLAQAIQKLVDLGTKLNEVTIGIVEVWQQFAKWLGNAADVIADMDGDTVTFIGNIIALGSALGVVGGALAIGGTLMGGLSSLAGLVGTGGALSAGLTGLVAILSGPVGLGAGIVAAGAAVVNFSLGQMAEDSEIASKAIAAQSAEVKKLTDQIKELPLSANTVEIWAAIDTGDLESAQQLINDIVGPDYVAELRTEADQQELIDYWDRLSDIPAEKQTELLAILNSGDVAEIESFFDELDDVDVSVGAKVDEPSIKKVTETLEYEFDGEKYSIEVPVNSEGIDKVKNDIDSIPTEKQLEITLQGEIDTQIAQIQASADVARDAFKYTAEVDIVQAQEATKQVEATFDSINTSITSTGDVISSALSGIDSEDFQTKWAAQDVLREEQDLRQQSFDLQKKLTEEQIKYMEARTAALEDGGAEITIDSSGLEPALEMVMWQILEKVQIRANENASDFLLGL